MAEPFDEPISKFSKPTKCKTEGCQKFGWYQGFCNIHKRYGNKKQVTIRKKKAAKKRKAMGKREKKAKLLAYKEEKKRKAALRPRTPKRQRQEALYSVQRIAYLTENPLCEVCRMDATDIHHKKGRIGELLIQPEYFLSVCRSCHDRIHQNPAWAYEQGYMLRK